MEKFIKDVFGEILEKIQDVKIREKTIKAWVMAAKEGGWTSAEILKIPFTLLTETHGINLIEHTVAVTNGAAALANAKKSVYHKMPYEINMDYVYAGGLLHDVGKLLEIECVGGKYQKSLNGKCTRHPFSGAIIAAKVGLCDAILNTIANHAKEGDGRPMRVETILIHQADFATFNPLVYKAKGILIEEG